MYNEKQRKDLQLRSLESLSLQLQPFSHYKIT